ncbi:MAG: site-2 protease family protein [Bacteroidota bacterium]
MNQHRSFHNTLLMVLVCILPLFVFFVLVVGGVRISPIFFLLVLVVCCGAMMYFMRGAPMSAQPEDREPADEAAGGDLTLLGKVSDVFALRTQYKEGTNLVAEGKLLADPDRAYEAMKERFEKTDVTPLLQEDDSGRPIVALVPGALQRHGDRPQKVWLNAILFLATVVTTTIAGAAHQGVSLWSNPEEFSLGLPYAGALLAILGAHELGHYFAAKKHGMRVTLPYFIPVPFALGTFGAFIQLKSPSENRKALFDVGVAGPLAGLVFAIPALMIGLQYSTIVPSSETGALMDGGTDVGSSLLLAILANLSVSETLSGGHQFLLHPLAFAGWLGLLVTALNLLPIGQLDGGHIAHALFGRKNSNTIGMVALFSLFLLGLFVWSGLLTWAIIVFFIAGTKSAPPLNDVSRLDGTRVAIGVLAFVLLFLILTPVPHAFHEVIGIHCPYV